MPANLACNSLGVGCPANIPTAIDFAPYSVSAKFFDRRNLAISSIAWLADSLLYSDGSEIISSGSGNQLVVSLILCENAINK